MIRFVVQGVRSPEQAEAIRVRLLEAEAQRAPEAVFLGPGVSLVDMGKRHPSAAFLSAARARLVAGGFSNGPGPVSRRMG